MANGIPIGEFVRLLEQAEEAIAEEDMAQLDSINEALKRAGQRVIIKDGKAYLQTNLSVSSSVNTLAYWFVNTSDHEPPIDLFCVSLDARSLTGELSLKSERDASRKSLDAH